MKHKKVKTRRKSWHRFLPDNYLGLAVALISFCVSLLPSLLPRPWLFQGIVSGFSVAIGYGAGTLLSFCIRWMTQSDVPKRFKRPAWLGLAAVSVLSVLFFIYRWLSWQNQVRDLVGEAHIGQRHMFRMLLITLLLGMLLVLIGRGIRLLDRRLINLIDRLLPRRVSVGLGTVLMAVFLWWLLSGVLAHNLISFANTTYRTHNDKTPAGISQPVSSDRSGSKDSLVKWDDLGYQGKAFVATGPSVEKLQSFGDKNPVQPIRVYVGLKSADTPANRAQLAVKELERTHAFSRKVLVIATPTGTGWLQPQFMDSVEYMYGGNTAIVGQQYSYLPSWISFLADKQNATDSAQALYDAVYAKWSSLPANSRPKLLDFGLSLGSYGGQSAFSSAADERRSVDGALFVGTPNDTKLWQTITADREPSSPEWQPIYTKSPGLVFAASNQDINNAVSNWQAPRILYLQHASDPIVWFNFNIAFHEPDWLKEPAGADATPHMHWFPIVTFLQMGVDQFFGASAPNGHGHSYANSAAYAWAAVAQPSDWTSSQTDQLQKLLNTYPK